MAAEDSAAATEDTTEDTTEDITADFTAGPSLEDFTAPEDTTTAATDMAEDALADCWAF